jgi:hypothetical protein
VSFAASHALIVAGVAFALAGIQLWARFQDRRPFSSAKTALLFAVICLFAGVVGGLIELTTPGRLAVLGIGAAVPFASPTPGSDGKLPRTRGTTSQSIAATAARIWAVTGFLANELDDRLARLRGSCVQELEALLASQYDAANLPDPANVALESLLKRFISGITDERRRALREAELRSAYDTSVRESHSIVALLELVYDWNLEVEVRRIVQERS